MRRLTPSPTEPGAVLSLAPMLFPGSDVTSSEISKKDASKQDAKPGLDGRWSSLTAMQPVPLKRFWPMGVSIGLGYHQVKQRMSFGRASL